ncbi:MAG: T9SS type A sorting domain-containing protein [Bacteroidia bacterium]
MATFLSTAVLTINAQTSVSGGIYSNTTWTLAGSPYTATANVIVFPGVTLTVDPGVIVKFDPAVQLELRQARLIANGTAGSPISFTSNGSTTPGNWDAIFLNGGTMNDQFNYCNFEYASKAINGSAGDSIVIQNCNFSYNLVGIEVGAAFTSYGILQNCTFLHNSSVGANNLTGFTVSNCNFALNNTGLFSEYCSIDNCMFSQNQTGFYGDKDNTLTNCTSTQNYQTGFYCGRACHMENCISTKNQNGIVAGNTIHDDYAYIKNTIVDSNTVAGITIGNRKDSIFYCQIRYNGTGFIDNNSDSAWPNVITKNNIESNATGVQIANNTYDSFTCNKICSNTGYDLNYGGTNNYTFANNYFCTADAAVPALIYDGYDNPSYGLITFLPTDSSCSSSVATGIHEEQGTPFSIFPNPATDHLTLELSSIDSRTVIRIYNILGALEYSSGITEPRNDLDISSLSKGIYFIQVNTEKGSVRQKFIKQ